MREIKCPNCGELFQIDETGYTQIVKQIRDEEFEKELERFKEDFNQKKESDLILVKMQEEKRFSEQLAEIKEKINEKDKLIEMLKARMEGSESDRNLAVSEAVQAKEKELSDMLREITELKGKLSSKDTELQLNEKNLKERYEIQLRLKDEQIEQYKDFKARQSTKMIGESLEQHCSAQFNSIRASAFPNAYFEKDNDSRGGSKGDFIFRESSEDGAEFVSIMFEMKNEMDTTASKHKNEDFFEKLDKDRREKNCEYAVLVSMLEPESELYNNGIVDVSYRYPKMYVVRPQFFIPMISLLRNAALNSLEYRRELQIIKNQQLDIMHFEESLDEFKKGFGRNYELASRKFQDAIDGIDKTIKALEKTKADLLSSDRNLRLANDKAQDLSIKRLTKNAPSIREMFENKEE